METATLSVTLRKILSRFAVTMIASLPLVIAALPTDAMAAKLTVAKAGTGSGLVVSSPAGISCGSTCSWNYWFTRKVSLTATANAGSVFTGWSGICTGTAATTTFVLASKSTCTATFALAAAPAAAPPQTVSSASLTTSKAGTGSGVITSAPAGISCGSICTYGFATNTAVTLTAIPDSGSIFTGWSGNCSGSLASTQIVIATTSSCTATFALPPATKVGLWVTLTGSGAGVVTSAPAGITCGSACTYSYDLNTVVTLTATANTGSSFAGWSGSCAGSSVSTQIALAANTTCYASFSSNVALSPNTRYLSPSGNDAADGMTTATPWKTFAKAFSAMGAGNELVLLDGIYSEANGTGYISYLGTNSGQPPSGLGLSAMTYVHALNAGKVTVKGQLFLGRSTRKDSYIMIRGITFVGGGSLYNTSYVTIKDTGFNGPFGVGTNDHANGNTDNLVEDVWVWATDARIIAINYRADRNVWRRMIVRGDGCTTAECTASGSPNVGFTVYESRDVSVQNVLVVDRVLSSSAISAGNAYADFASAQHTASSALYLGRNEWLGSASINAPDAGFWFEADMTIPAATTWTLRDVVAIGTGIGGLNVGSTGSTLIANATVINANQTNDGVRVAPGSPGAGLSNVIVKGFGRGLNSSLPPSYTDTFGSAVLYNQTAPTIGARTTNPLADGTTPSLKYPMRVESGSALKSAGQNGADIGANIVNRYGVDGSRVGEPNYNLLSANTLWPWPNQTRIKQEMCANTQRGFCSTGLRLDASKPISLTSYVWEQLGNPVPATVDP